MEIFLLRHATRDFVMGDVPLNETGLEQAKALAERRFFSSLTHILCSPKQRALMTVQPLAEKYDIEIIQEDDLDQMKGHESEAEFIARVKSFLNRFETPTNQNILICSHSDWLSVAIQQIPTDALDVKYRMFQCADVMGFKVVDGIWQIQD